MSLNSDEKPLLKKLKEIDCHIRNEEDMICLANEFGNQLTKIKIRIYANHITTEAKTRVIDAFGRFKQLEST